jgi:hypothetical protein
MDWMTSTSPSRKVGQRVREEAYRSEQLAVGEQREPRIAGGAGPAQDSGTGVGALLEVLDDEARLGLGDPAAQQLAEPRRGELLSFLLRHPGSELEAEHPRLDGPIVQEGVHAEQAGDVAEDRLEQRRLRAGIREEASGRAPQEVELPVALAQDVFRRLALGDVGNDTDEPRRSVHAAARHSPARCHPAHAALGMHGAALQGEFLAGSERGRRLEVVPSASTVLGMDALFQPSCEARHAAGRVQPEQLEGLRRPGCPFGTDPPIPGAGVSRFQDFLEPRVAVGSRAACLHLPADDLGGQRGVRGMPPPALIDLAQPGERFCGAALL